MVNMLLSEAQPPIKRSTLRWTAVHRPHFMEPHMASRGSQEALPPGEPGFVQDDHSREALVPHMFM